MGTKRTRRSPRSSLRESLAAVRTVEDAVLLLVNAGLDSDDFQTAINYPTFRERLVTFWKNRGFSSSVTPEETQKIMGDRMITVEILEKSRDYSTVFNGRIGYDLPLLDRIPYKEADLSSTDVDQILLPVVEYNDLVSYRPFQFDGDGSWSDLVYLCDSEEYDQTSWWALLRDRYQYLLEAIPENERIATVYEYLFWCFASGRISDINKESVLCKKVMRNSVENAFHYVTVDGTKKTITVIKRPTSEIVNIDSSICRRIYTVLKPCLMA